MSLISEIFKLALKPVFFTTKLLYEFVCACCELKKKLYERLVLNVGIKAF